uniref:Cyclic nucleotide-binding domain-containing protein n=1 Tax=Candidatus Kentrum sp. LPFa TaxID=2126335 RepID=A0A450WN65_9GAMM|nr:MAG: Cyclic nucleotide-binding domain-containing protein [Candidatus Kentron sp. LPFa]
MKFYEVVMKVHGKNGLTRSLASLRDDKTHVCCHFERSEKSFIIGGDAARNMTVPGFPMLSNTKLATSISPEILTEVERLGEPFYPGPGRTLFRAGEEPHYLYVLLEGDVLVEMGRKPAIWIGQGDIIGEIGFILGTKRTGNVRTSSGCALWRIRRSLIFRKDMEALIPMTRLLLSLDSHIRIRLRELDAEIESLTSTLASADSGGAPMQWTIAISSILRFSGPRGSCAAGTNGNRRSRYGSSCKASLTVSVFGT